MNKMLSITAVKLLDFLLLPISVIGFLYYLLIETPIFQGRMRGLHFYRKLIEETFHKEAPDEHEDIDKQ